MTNCASTLFLFAGFCSLQFVIAYNNYIPCGQASSTARESRIVGGHNAKPHEFPWLVSITRKGGHFCGGTILNSKFILTAAHCVCSGTAVFPATQFRVILGEHDLRKAEEPAAREEHVSKILIHPEHVCGKYINDIAILELNDQISWSEVVKPACFPNEAGKAGYSKFAGERAIAAGWGWLGENRTIHKRADILQKVDVRVLENSDCAEWYANQGKLTRVQPKQMCAGHKEGGRDSCWADSGGPLMTGIEDTEDKMVIGVVSSGVGCARPQLPGIYTRVSDYISWITDQVIV